MNTEGILYRVSHNYWRFTIQKVPWIYSTFFWYSDNSFVTLWRSEIAHLLAVYFSNILVMRS